MNTVEQIYNWEKPEQCKIVDLKDMPYNEAGFKVSIYGSKELQISRYLRRLLDYYQDNTACNSLLLPSVNELSIFFSCNTEQVLHGLDDLVKRGYGYEVEGLTCPLKFWDPLVADALDHTSLNEMFKTLMFWTPKTDQSVMDAYTQSH